MHTTFPFFTLANNATINIRDALDSVLSDQKVSRDELAKELGIGVERLSALLDATSPKTIEPWVEVHDRLVEVLTSYGLLSD
jgi:hypothetical protein